MSRYVIDASVAIKWFLPENDDEIAKSLATGGHDLVVPTLLTAELGNVLWKRFQRGELNVDDAKSTLSGLSAMRLEWRPIELYAAGTVEIACRLGRTYYDSLYLAIAVAEDAPLVTADERLYNAVAATPLSNLITLLSTLS